MIIMNLNQDDDYDKSKNNKENMKHVSGCLLTVLQIAEE